MDLYIERQCVEAMKAGDTKKFILLYDDTFEKLYKYVSRRVYEHEEAKMIVRLVFLDALGQIANTPEDLSYLTWLYVNAKPRVWNFIAKSSFPEKQGLISIKKDDIDEADLVGRVNNMMSKLTLEEREIIRLKFFEQVTDGDVMEILEIDEAALGQKIYRVLKRAHVLLFGDNAEEQGVYFGQLSGIFEKIREKEAFKDYSAFKLELKTEIANKIERKDFAIDGEVIQEEAIEETNNDYPENEQENKKGSDDPAKIFVEAVREMKEEEEQERLKEQKKLERKEKIYDFIDRWKVIFILIPIIIFIGIVILLFLNLWNYFDKVERGYPNTCDIEVQFEGDFTDGEKRNINTGVTNRLCDHFEVERLLINRVDDGIVEVEVDVPDWFLEYRFIRKITDWRIKKNERTFKKDSEPGEI